MIASPTIRRGLSGHPRRSAFTLLEVLVVVAILIVLASVASVAVFRYFEEAKEDKATLDMQALTTNYNALVLKSGGEVGPSNFTPDMLIPYFDQGRAALIDPWGNPYNHTFGTSEGGDQRIQWSCTTPKQKLLVWPRQ